MTAPAAPHAGRHRFRPWLLAVAAAVVVGGTSLGLGLSGGTNREASSGESVQAAQLASVRTGCQDWLRTNPSQPGTAQWCDAMTQWMQQHLGRYGAGPQALWGDPSALAAACGQWMAQGQPSGVPAGPGGWCGAMTSWMSAHLGQWSGRGSWSDWMRDGPMGGLRAPATQPPAPRSSATAPANSASAGSTGDADHDGDCEPGSGDTDHDGDCGPVAGSGGYGPGPMMRGR